MASSEEATSKLRAWRSAEHRKGTDTELLAIGGAAAAKLSVLCGDRFEASRAFRAGDFSARIIRVSGTPLAMATCMVADHQWMLAKDSKVLRVGARSFVFALPGLLYGLALPASCSDDEFHRLEGILSSYSSYQDIAEKETDGSGPANLESDSEMWARAYAEILKLASRSNHRIAAAAATTSSGAPPVAGSRLSALAATDMVTLKIQRAVRMSAAVKLASRALLSGALSPPDHLHMSSAPAPVPWAPLVLPTMWAAAELLDVIESGALPPPTRSRRAPPEGFWGFSREGLAMLMDVVRAYGASNAGARKRPRLDTVEEEPPAPGGLGGGCGGGRGGGSELGKQMRTC